MLTKDDITGVCVMIATPCKEGGDSWDNTDSVDLEETARLAELMAGSGVGSIAGPGTTGECAALLWEEKLGFVDTIIQVNRHRVPVFAGVTALGTKEVVRQMRAFKDLGAEGAFVGLPLWETPTLDDQIRFYADLSAAVPEMAILVYANPNFFKSNFPTPLWEGIARYAPNVVASKGAASKNVIVDNVKVAGHQVRFMPNDVGTYEAYKLAPDNIKACWSTSANMGPEPVVAFMDAVQKQDDKRVEELNDELQAVPEWIAVREEMKLYNLQAAKHRFRAAGLATGPTRVPYHDDNLPEAWQKAGEAHAKGWLEWRSKYVKSPV